MYAVWTLFFFIAGIIAAVVAADKTIQLLNWDAAAGAAAVRLMHHISKTLLHV